MRGLRSAMFIGVLGLGIAGGTAIGTLVSSGNSSARPMDEERHPEIHRAMEALHNAHDALVHADRDFDGHRKAAVDAVDVALNECQACLDTDKH